jgi:tetratricopeptide (TPR) repeat protein
MTGDLLGTLRYMSPEQALGRPVILDHRTDIYSLGVTLYELLTLQPAFDGKDRQEILRQIAFEEPKAPRRLRLNVPSELETIVLKAMEKESEARYATAGELAADLRRWLMHEPIRARRAGMLQRARKWGRRNKTLVHSALIATQLVLICLAGSSYLIWRKQKETQAAWEQVDEQRKSAERHAATAQRRRQEAEANYRKLLYGIVELARGTQKPSVSRLEHAHTFRHEVGAHAIQIISSLIKNNDTTPEARFRRGLAYRHLAHIHEVMGAHDLVEPAFRQAATLLEELANECREDAFYWHEAAFTQNILGDYLHRLKRPDALEQLASARDKYHRAVTLQEDARAFNNFAYFLLECSDPQLRDPLKAVEMARSAVERDPAYADFWETLGLAYYRTSSWSPALSAFLKARQLKVRFSGFTSFYLAMTCWQLGHREDAQKHYVEGVQWMDANQPDHVTLVRLRAEAENLLGIPGNRRPPVEGESDPARLRGW